MYNQAIQNPGKVHTLCWLLRSVEAPLAGRRAVHPGARRAAGHHHAAPAPRRQPAQGQGHVGGHCVHVVHAAAQLGALLEVRLELPRSLAVSTSFTPLPSPALYFRRVIAPPPRAPRPSLRRRNPHRVFLFAKRSCREWYCERSCREWHNHEWHCLG